MATLLYNSESHRCGPPFISEENLSFGSSQDRLIFPSTLSPYKELLQKLYLFETKVMKRAKIRSKTLI